MPRGTCRLGRTSHQLHTARVSRHPKARTIFGGIGMEFSTQDVIEQTPKFPDDWADGMLKHSVSPGTVSWLFAPFAGLLGPDDSYILCDQLRMIADADHAEYIGELQDSFILTKEIHNESLDNFKGKLIIVEASYYLQRFLDTPPYSEPLLSALGGSPLALRTHIEADLDKWARTGITPFFVFEGQSIVGKEEKALNDEKVAMAEVQRAWSLYTENEADRAVATFGASGAVGPKRLCRFLQEILLSKEIRFIVAPYSACAEVAFLDLTEDWSDGIFGSLEILLYDMHKDSSLITSIDFDKHTASGVIKSDLLKKLHVSEDNFIDCFLMLGTSFLPRFPTLMNTSIVREQPPTIKSAINMFRTCGSNINRLCLEFSDDLAKGEPQWEDKYRKAKMSIKHSIVATSDGKIEVRAYEHLTSDAHEYLGLQLPAELDHYLLHAAIGPRVMNWLSTSCLRLSPPLDGGMSEEYRRLVTQQLIPIREQTLALYTTRMHRAFQFKKVSMKVWYDENFNVELDHHNFRPQPQDQVKTWSIKGSEFENRETTIKAQPGSLNFAIVALEDEEFATSTISTGPKLENLEASSEILVNVIWRFLHLRGYIGDDHKLTRWGRALAAALRELGQATQLDEAAFLAVELLRYDQLNARNRHEEWIDFPQQGSDSDKTSCLLIARCACLVKLQHKAIGYTGPLSKNLLAQHSLISAVRQSDRDLIEATLASAFLNAEVKRKTKPPREPEEYTRMSLSLPCDKDVDIGLGIAVKTYLDSHSSSTYSSAEKDAQKQAYAKTLIPHHVNFGGDLDLAFKFFDAIYAAVKILGDDVPDQAVWKEASDYLAQRR